MELENAKKQTQGTRRVQTGSHDEYDARSSTGLDESSDQPGLESFSSSGENWPGGNKVKGFINSTVGKLIDRLIDSWKDREKEAKDCLDWYNQQLVKCRKEVELLELMKAEMTEALAKEE